MANWFTKSDGTHVNTDSKYLGISSNEFHDKGSDVVRVFEKGDKEMACACGGWDKNCEYCKGSGTFHYKNKEKTDQEFAKEILKIKKMDEKELGTILEIMEDVARETGEDLSEIEKNDELKERVIELLEEDQEQIRHFKDHRNSKLNDMIPEVMSARVFDFVVDGEHKLNSKAFESFDKALKFEKERNGVLLTQVDAEGETYYEKGSHLVNRTGRYEVIFEK